jgi:hypothetical protein
VVDGYMPVVPGGADGDPAQHIVEVAGISLNRGESGRSR